MKQNQKFHIAIVGLGPKGLYAFEHLLRNLNNSLIHIPVVIHLFNAADSFGAGDIYHPEQPNYLKMNFADYRLNQITETPEDSLWAKHPNYCNWLKENHFAHQKKGEHFSARATVGKFLNQLFENLMQLQIGNVSVQKHHAEVFNINKKDSALEIVAGRNNNELYTTEVSSVLLATGHRGNRKIKEEKKDNHDYYIPFIYPVNEQLNNIKSRSKVAVKGMGLTFIDAVLALTEGRGGEFVQKNGNLLYEASGKEPSVIYPFSRSGLPMIPRTATHSKPRKLHFFKAENGSFENPKFSKQYNFEKDLLPFIKQEFVFRYYQMLFQRHGQQLTLENTFSDIQLQISHFHQQHPEIRPFTFSDFYEPFNKTNGNFHNLISTYSQYLIHECSDAQSPLSAAISAWHDISPVFNELYKFGGLEPDSHQLFDNEYAGFFNRISYGPPLENFKKMHALAEAGIINYTYARSPELQSHKGKFTLAISSKSKICKVSTDYFIDARIPKNSSGNEGHLLYQNLKNKDDLHLFRNNKNGVSYEPGCFAINKQGVLYEDDENNLLLSMYGTPTEGLTFDNDTLSRSRNNFGKNWARQTVQLILKEQNQ